MIGRPRLKGLGLFAAGFLAAVLVMYVVFANPSALADQYSCIRTDLDAQGMTGNIGDSEFTITYNVPSCYASSGYAVDRVYMYGGQVAVHYKKQ